MSCSLLKGIAWTFKSRSIANFHFQLHHNFRMISLKDCIYSTKTGIERLNLSTGEKKNYGEFKNVMSLNVSFKNDLIALGYTDSNYSILSLSTGKIIKTDKLINEESIYTI